MEDEAAAPTAAKLPPGSRHLNLKQCFNLAARSLLTSCSKQEFLKAFPTFTVAEQESLHKLFTQVISSLHDNIQDEFESLCLDTQVGTIVDTVEELVEEQSLDPLFFHEANLEDTKSSLLTAQKNEIEYLKGKLKAAEEHKQMIMARIEYLKKENGKSSGAINAAEKFRFNF